jgi:hypothetical protein
MGPAQIEREGRVRRRMQHLGMSAHEAAALAADVRREGEGVGAVSFAPAAARAPGFERLIGDDDMLSSAFLERGAQVARAVCCIREREQRIGTGFLVGARLLLTNAHVLPDADAARDCEAEFDFEDGPDGDRFKTPVQFALDPDALFVASPEDDLDYALVAVRPASGGRRLEEFPPIALDPAVGKVLRGESLNIIQHPNGAPKRVAIRQNRFTALLEKYMHYETDTQPGSSGSPVFNDQWQVVCLHHKGVPLTDSQDRILTKDNRPWDHDRDDPALIQWVGNEGVRISRIVDDVHARLAGRPRPAALAGFPEPTGHPPSEDEQLGGAATRDDGDDRTADRVGYQDSRGAVAAPARNGTDESPKPSSARVEITVSLGGASRTFTMEPGVTDEPGPGRVAGEPPRLTVAQWRELVLDERTTEADLRPYVVADEARSGPFDPVFRIDPRRVIDPVGLESDTALTWANRWCRERRRQRYLDRLAAGGPVRKVVAEGDSWFQYPIVLHDIIDNLMDRPDLAILSLDAAGDLLRDMIASGEYLRAIRGERPGHLLLSGGGNDLVGDGRLATMLHPYSPRRRPEDYPNPTFDAFLDEMRGSYRRLIESALAAKPGLRIVCHGYDHVLPAGGRWLGQPMARQRIPAGPLQAAIMRGVIDRVNLAVGDLARGYPSVRFLDLRGTVRPYEWYDELHPNDAGFRKVAAIFADALR